MPPWQSATYSSDGDRTLATYIYNAETVDDRKNDLDKLDYGNGDSVEYEYDDKGRVTKQTYFEGATEKGNVTYTYDNDGALAKVTDSATGITTTYYYDLTGRTMKYVESSSGYSHSVGYEYDTLNNLTQLVEAINDTEHTTSYTYDDDNRITSVTNDGIKETYGYDQFGRITSESLKLQSGTTSRVFYGYKSPSTGTTSSQVNYYSIQIGSLPSLTYRYTYDQNGNILTVNDSSYSFDSESSYTYDSANQLIREDDFYARKTYVWAYDNAGNILSRTEYAYTTGELGEPIDVVTYTYGDSQWGDLLTGYDGNTITYDAIGNPLTDGTWTYTWEHGRELAAMSNGTDTWTYSYDANGLRTKRTNGTDTYTYVYNGSQLTQMTVGDDTLYFAYDAAGKPMAVTHNGTVYYYVLNLQGDVILILDGDGNMLVSYIYDAWGNIIAGYHSSTLGALNPLRYRGYVYDNETELYYLQSRYYNPEMGRFINADAFIATGQGFVGNNMFAYCLNNPVLYADPSGDIVMESTILTAAAVVVLSLAASYCLAKALLLCVEWAGKKISDLHNPFPSAQEASQAEIFTQTPDTLMISETFPNDPVGKTVINEVSTKGRERMRDSGLAHETDEEVQQKAHDRSLPSSVRQRYKREEKARGLRNVQKRSLKYSVPIGGGFHLVLP